MDDWIMLSHGAWMLLCRLVALVWRLLTLTASGSQLSALEHLSIPYGAP